VVPRNGTYLFLCSRFADPHHLECGLDPPFHFEAYPDPTFYFDANPDPSHQK
jgi:hypothetical protein